MPVTSTPRRGAPSIVFPETRGANAPSMTAIRRRFVTDGVVSDGHVPTSILRSWQRCAALGMRMDMRPAAEAVGRLDLAERRERHARLRAAGGDEMRRLQAASAGTGGVVVLTDAEGVVLERLGEGAFAEKADRVALDAGFAWNETATGTNAIGTALAERREIVVFGAEHYFESHRILSCTAAPIVGPDGETLGVLDLSRRAETRSSEALDLVRVAVGAIERRLFLDGFADARIVAVHGDPAAFGDEREGLLAWRDDRLVGIDRRAEALLDLDRDGLAGCRWTDLFDGRRLGGEETARLVARSGRAVFGRLRESGATRAVGGWVPPASLPAPTPRPATRAEATDRFVWGDARRRALGRATRLLDADVPVLVQGETGTGKEVFARALHAASTRAGRPFVAVNCAALPEGLIEAELFGYEEGAFTGARRKGSKGLMREAEGGVLFLDEIGDMPHALQARLLRALQEREVTPLGGGRPVPVDFALVCATHLGLAEAIERRHFRQDLYFRIAQYTVELPPLRDEADLRGVIERMWRDAAGAHRVALTPAALDRLAGHHWPGNFRQLATTLRTLAILAEPGETLDVEALPADVRRAGRLETSLREAREEESPDARRTASSEAPRRLDDINRAAMRAALEACGGNVTRAAARLGVHRSTLHRRLLEDRS